MAQIWPKKGRKQRSEETKFNKKWDVSLLWRHESQISIGLVCNDFTTLRQLALGEALYDVSLTYARLRWSDIT